MGLADWSDDKLNKKISKQTTEKAIKKEIIEWIIKNTGDKIYKSHIKFDTTTTPWTVNYDRDIMFNTNITSLTNGLFQWGEVNKIFCCHCGKLDLKNVPENKLITECSNCNVSTFYHFENTLHTEISDKYNKCADPKFVKKVQEIHKNKVLPSLLNIKGEILSWKSVPLSIGCIPIHFDQQMRYEGYDDGKYLGLYRRNNDGTREIILFEDAIKSEAKGDNDYLKNLIWKVIIHEYAHAIMDAIFHDDNKLRKHDHKLYKYREESLANAFALKVLEMSIKNTLITKSGFSKIEDFVEYQPEEYRHGLDLYKSKDLLKMMEFWGEMKIEGNKRFGEN